MADEEAWGVGYTIATGRLFCGMDSLYKAAAVLLGRPVYTHEFAEHATWDALRKSLELRATARHGQAANEG